jgi:hypothetical protein
MVCTAISVVTPDKDPPRMARASLHFKSGLRLNLLLSVDVLEIQVVEFGTAFPVAYGMIKLKRDRTHNFGETDL